MKKYACSYCKTTKYVIRKTKRNRSILYFCRKCHKYFSINPVYLNKKAILKDHLYGLSYRKLASKYGMSKSLIGTICLNALKKLPDNNQFTHKYCNRYSHIFVVDGKYVKVKGYDRKIPLLWGIDYFRHDIPFFVLARAENYHGWAKYFSYFRIIDHHPQLVVCDDNYNIKIAARERIPSTSIQTCTNHFKENIRYELKARSDDTYKKLSRAIDSVLSYKHSDVVFNTRMQKLYSQYKHDSIAHSVLLNIAKNRHELLGYRGIRQAPMTTNIIECFNAHLQDRLCSIRCFNSYTNARLWLNGYILLRRYTKYTSCSYRFRRLNGKTGVSQTKKKGVELPTLF